MTNHTPKCHAKIRYGDWGAGGQSYWRLAWRLVKLPPGRILLQLPMVFSLPLTCFQSRQFLQLYIQASLERVTLQFRSYGSCSGSLKSI